MANIGSVTHVAFSKSSGTDLAGMLRIRQCSCIKNQGAVERHITISFNLVSSRLFDLLVCTSLLNRNSGFDNPTTMHRQYLWFLFNVFITKVIKKNHIN